MTYVKDTAQKSDFIQPYKGPKVSKKFNDLSTLIDDSYFSNFKTDKQIFPEDNLSLGDWEFVSAPEVPNDDSFEIVNLSDSEKKQVDEIGKELFLEQATNNPSQLRGFLNSPTSFTSKKITDLLLPKLAQKIAEKFLDNLAKKIKSGDKNFIDSFMGRFATDKIYKNIPIPGARYLVGPLSKTIGTHDYVESSITEMITELRGKLISNSNVNREQLSQLLQSALVSGQKLYDSSVFTQTLSNNILDSWDIVISDSDNQQGVTKEKLLEEYSKAFIQDQTKTFIGELFVQTLTEELGATLTNFGSGRLDTFAINGLVLYAVNNYKENFKDLFEVMLFSNKTPASKRMENAKRIYQRANPGKEVSNKSLLAESVPVIKKKVEQRAICEGISLAVDLSIKKDEIQQSIISSTQNLKDKTSNVAATVIPFIGKMVTDYAKDLYSFSSRFFI